MSVSFTAVPTPGVEVVPGEYLWRREGSERRWVFLEHRRLRREWWEKRLEHQDHWDSVLNPRLLGPPPEFLSQ